MIEVTEGSLEGRIIKVLQQTYPITIVQLQQRLVIAKPILVRALKKLHTQGVIRLEPLPGTVYIRLLRSDIRFLGGKKQQAPLKHVRSKKPARSTEYDNNMYI